MTVSVSLPIVATTIPHKAAADEGFDIVRGEELGWLRFESTQTPVAIALTGKGTDWGLAVSISAVATELAAEAVPWDAVPAGLAAAFTASDIGALYRLLGRARMLGRSLPTAPLVLFTQKTARLPRTTEAERVVVQRIGQTIFREALLDYWNGCCPISGIDDPRLLRASHMKPWADCETDAERLDVHNGLLLAAHLDAAFDAGLISFASDGALMVATMLSVANTERLGLYQPPHLPLSPAHAPFLAWHRQEVFKG